MKAIAQKKYGNAGVLQLMDLEKPEPGSGQVRVRVHAAALNPIDCEIRQGGLRVLSGRRFPRIPGSDFAGVVDAVGQKVASWSVGDRVYGFTFPLKGGAYAEYLVVDADAVSRIPQGLDFAEAAGIPLAAQTSLQALRDLGRLQRGQRVFIHGASGGVGTTAVPIAKALGAHVTASCSYRNTAMVQQLGADAVIDYTQQDLTQIEGPFDLYFDVYGNMPFPRVRHLLAPGGHHVSTIPAPANFLWAFLTRLFFEKKAHVVVVRSRREDLDTLNEWITAGRLSPVVDRQYPLEQAREAQEYLETRRASGKIILTINETE